MQGGQRLEKPRIPRSPGSLEPEEVPKATRYPRRPAGIRKEILKHNAIIIRDWQGRFCHTPVHRHAHSLESPGESQSARELSQCCGRSFGTSYVCRTVCTPV